jgi:tRNA threonylcarbamoyladenosine biosynthesis protein TsaB
VAGVGALEALAASAGTAGFVAAGVDARREQLYLQVFSDGEPLMAPDALTLGDAAARLVELHPGGTALLVGSGAPMLAPAMSGAVVLDRTAPDPAVIARLAARASSPAPPRPLYLRAPDAKLPG